MVTALLSLALLLAGYVAACYALACLMVVMAWLEVAADRRRRQDTDLALALSPERLPGTTVVIPAFNEEACIVRTVASALDLHYPDLEVVVVNDGSSDRTLPYLVRAFDLVPVRRPPGESIPTEEVRNVFAGRQEPRLLVLDKTNGGKADALNAGINQSTRELVCVVDADVVLDPDSLAHLAVPFVEDPETFAASGTIRPLNGCVIDASNRVVPQLPSRLLEAFQVLEYIRAFTVGRLFFNRVGAHILVSGAFGLFRKSALLQIGGYHNHAIGEDMELVVRAQRTLRAAGLPCRIHSVPSALLYTEAPRSLKELGRQRTRWHQGLLTSLRMHRTLFLNPRFGAVGLVAYPYFVLFELLSPVLEAFGWLVLPVAVLTGIAPPGPALALLLASTLLSVGLSTAALALDAWYMRFFRRPSDWLRLAAVAAIEPFGYHQANLYFRLRAFPSYYGRVHLRAGWMPPERRGAATGSRAPEQGSAGTR